MCSSNLFPSWGLVGYLGNLGEFHCFIPQCFKKPNQIHLGCFHNIPIPYSHFSSLIPLASFCRNMNFLLLALDQICLLLHK